MSQRSRLLVDPPLRFDRAFEASEPFLSWILANPHFRVVTPKQFDDIDPVTLLAKTELTASIVRIDKAIRGFARILSLWPQAPFLLPLDLRSIRQRLFCTR